MSALSNFLRDELNRRNWSQRDLETRTGIPDSTLSRIMAGIGETRASYLVKIAEALEMDFWRLMTIAGYPAPEGSTDTQELLDNFPWLGDFARVLAELKPEQRSAVLAYIRLLQEQSQSHGKGGTGRSS